MRVPLWFKLPVAFGLLLAIVSYSSWQAVVGVREIKSITTARLRDDTIPGLNGIGQIGFLIAALRGDFWRLHAVIADPTAHDQLLLTMRGRQEQIHKAMAAYEAAIANDEDRKNFTALQTLLDRWISGFDAAFEKDRENDQVAFQAQGVANAKLFANEIMPLLKTMTELNTKWINDALNDTLELTHSVEQSAQRGAGIVIGIGLTIAILLCLHILIPLARCRREVDAMAQGRINQGSKSQTVSRRGDELGDITRSTHAMGEYLEAMVAVANAIAAGKLTVSVTARGSDDALGTAFSSMHRQLTSDIRMLTLNSGTMASAAQELTAVAAQMATSAEESSMQSNEVSSAGEQVHQSVTTVAAAMEEMDASIKGITANAQEMSTQITAAATIAAALAQSSEQVGEIVKTVQSTADRTNLLALNATIEAASAGEAGRGFAVVANEVKELAKQSLAAAEQANRILTLMSTQAIEVKERTNTASQTVNAVAAAVEQQSATASDIGRNMNEAARAAAQIASSITEIAATGRETAAGVTQVKHSAEDLAKQAAEISTMVGRFTLPA